MLKEISKMEQRYDAVLLVIKDGFSVTEVAKKVGVSRQSLYTWMAAYEADGLAGLSDRSHRPHHVPHQMDATVESLVVQMRLAHPRWGAKRLAYELDKQHDRLPSLMAIHRALTRHGRQGWRPNTRLAGRITEHDYWESVWQLARRFRRRVVLGS